MKNRKFIVLIVGKIQLPHESWHASSLPILRSLSSSAFVEQSKAFQNGRSRLHPAAIPQEWRVLGYKARAYPFLVHWETRLGMPFPELAGHPHSQIPDIVIRSIRAILVYFALFVFVFFVRLFLIKKSGSTCSCTDRHGIKDLLHLVTAKSKLVIPDPLRMDGRHLQAFDGTLG